MEAAFEGKPRIYNIKRSPHLGYGFIAGHEQPTMVKIIEPNGPSFKRLLPGDVIMAVNGIDVETAPREKIIKMIQLCDDEIEIKVRQPTYEEIIRAKNLADPKFYMFHKPPIEDNQHSQRKQISRNGSLGRNGIGTFAPMPQRCKSSIDGTQTLKASNKKSGDIDNDQPLLKRSNTMRPIRPPAKVMEIFEVVIKIFFEDGHTRVISYNQNTTVDSILETLNERLIGTSPHAEQLKKYFGLALTVHSEDQSNKRKLLHILEDNDSIMKIRQLPYASKLRLLYRMIHPPSDVSQLYTQDKVAFEYLYKQSCNDLRAERFYPDLDSDTALKLAALHLLEYVYSNYPKAHGNSKDPKIYLKLVKKTPGLEHFIPASMIESTLNKKGERVKKQFDKLKTRLTEQIRKNFEEFDFEPPRVKSTTNLNRYKSTSFHELSLPEFKSSPSDCIKLMFLSFLSQLPGAGESSDSRAEPAPLPRQQVPVKQQDYNSIDRLYDQRYSSYSQKSIEELLKTAIIPPPPPPLVSDILYYDNFLPTRRLTTTNFITPVLSDQDLERLKVPRPPKLTYIK